MSWGGSIISAILKNSQRSKDIKESPKLPGNKSNPPEFASKRDYPPRARERVKEFARKKIRKKSSSPPPNTPSSFLSPPVGKKLETCLRVVGPQPRVTPKLRIAITKANVRPPRTQQRRLNKVKRKNSEEKS